MNQQIVDYYINNHEHLKELIKPYQTEYNRLINEEVSILKNDIEKEFIYMVKLILVNEASKALATDTESCLMVVEDINIWEFLK